MCAAPLRRVPHGAGVVAAVIEDNRCSGRGMDIDAADVAGQLAAEGVDPDRLLWVEIVVGVIDPQLVSCAPAGGAGAGLGQLPFGFGAFGDDAEAVGPGVDIVEVEDHLQRGGEEGILRGACNIAAIFAGAIPASNTADRRRCGL